MVRLTKCVCWAGRLACGRVCGVCEGQGVVRAGRAVRQGIEDLMGSLSAEQMLDLDDHRYRTQRSGGLVCGACGRGAWLVVDQGQLIQACLAGHLLAVG